MLSLSQLRQPLTRTQALERVTNLFTSLGFQTTSWADGSIQKTFLMSLAIVLSDASEVVKTIAEFGFNAYSTGVALSEFSRSRYQNERVEAVATKGPMTLSSTASIPYTIAVGQLIVATSSGIEFRNTTGGTLSAGSAGSPSTLVLTFEARKKGAQGNVANGAVTRLLTPLAGVSVANSSGTPWYTTAGSDEESDASLRARNQTKWATLTVEYVAETYEAIARDAGATKVKVHASNPRGPGTIDVYCAADTARLGTSTMQAIQEAFAARAFQTTDEWAHPWTDTDSRVATRHPTEAELDVTATLYHDPSVDGATIVTRARTALEDFLAALPIGGSDYSPGPANVVLREDIIDVLKSVEGVRTVVLTTPSATVGVGTLALVVEGTWSLTPVAVT